MRQGIIADRMIKGKNNFDARATDPERQRITFRKPISVFKKQFFALVHAHANVGSSHE